MELRERLRLVARAPPDIIAIEDDDSDMPEPVLLDDPVVRDDTEA